MVPGLPLDVPSSCLYLATDGLAPMRIHGSLAQCVGLPNTNAHNAMLGTADPIRFSVKFGDVADGLSNAICFVKSLANKVHGLTVVILPHHLPTISIHFTEIGTLRRSRFE